MSQSYHKGVRWRYFACTHSGQAWGHGTSSLNVELFRMISLRLVEKTLNDSTNVYFYCTGKAVICGENGKSFRNWQSEVITRSSRYSMQGLDPSAALLDKPGSEDGITWFSCIEARCTSRVAFRRDVSKNDVVGLSNTFSASHDECICAAYIPSRSRTTGAW